MCFPSRVFQVGYAWGFPPVFPRVLHFPHFFMFFCLMFQKQAPIKLNVPQIANRCSRDECLRGGFKFGVAVSFKSNYFRSLPPFAALDIHDHETLARVFVIRHTWMELLWSLNCAFLICHSFSEIHHPSLDDGGFS